MPEKKKNNEKNKGSKIRKRKLVKKDERKSVRAPFDKDAWKPKTEIGKKVKQGIIKNLDEILDNCMHIKEAEIIDVLLPDLEIELLLVGQAKGKFGGGQRRIFRQTQKKTSEGNKPKFATLAIVGNKNGFVGMGMGKSKETVPAREKAIRNAKLNIIKIRRGCGSWECGCKEPHSFPFSVNGKSGASELVFMPAPKGTGLVVEKECQKILKMAGVNDAWSKQLRSGKTKLNLIYACFEALKKLLSMKVKHDLIEKAGIVEGAVKNE